MADNFRNLTAYKKAFELAMDIFKVTRSFPKEERYSLVDQIRRSSRAVCSCIGEAYRKRDYEGYLVRPQTRIAKTPRRVYISTFRFLASTSLLKSGMNSIPRL